MDSEYSRVAGALRKLNESDRRIVSHLRKRETNAEERFWKWIRHDQILGVRFRRQHKIGRFVVDFFSFKCHLAIEVDGKIHLRRVKEDTARTRWLEANGIRVIRFSNDSVFTQPSYVRTEIERVVSEQLKLFQKEEESDPFDLPSL